MLQAFYCFHEISLIITYLIPALKHSAEEPSITSGPAALAINILRHRYLRPRLLQRLASSYYQLFVLVAISICRRFTTAATTGRVHLLRMTTMPLKEGRNEMEGKGAGRATARE